MGVAMNETVRRVVGPTILLNSGNYLDLVAPEQSEFTLDDIAHGLSMTCRFSGQCGHFYSVAEHSVHVSRYVPVEDAYAGLMHDAAEAFVHDISKPLRVLLPGYSEIEKRIERVIFERYGVPNPLPPSIKELDIRMLATEQRRLMRNRDNWEHCHGREPLPIHLNCWSPDVAKARFLERFWEIQG
jgi:5'-nucleotidase